MGQEPLRFGDWLSVFAGIGILLLGLGIVCFIAKGDMLLKNLALAAELENPVLMNEADHLAWILAMQEMPAGDADVRLPGEMRLRTCRMGEWFRSEARRQAEALAPSIAEDLKALEIAHARLHRSIAAIEGLKETKPPQFRKEMEAVFRSEALPAFTEMREICRAVRMAVDEAEESYADDCKRALARINATLGVTLLAVAFYGAFTAATVIRSAGRSLRQIRSEAVEMGRARRQLSKTIHGMAGNLKVPMNRRKSRGIGFE